WPTAFSCGGVRGGRRACRAHLSLLSTLLPRRRPLEIRGVRFSPGRRRHIPPLLQVSPSLADAPATVVAIILGMPDRMVDDLTQRIVDGHRLSPMPFP